MSTSVADQVIQPEDQSHDHSHELSSYWTFWSQIVPVNPKPKMKANLGPIFDFNSVEDFWAVYNSLKAPHEVTTRMFPRERL